MNPNPLRLAALSALMLAWSALADAPPAAPATGAARADDLTSAFEQLDAGKADMVLVYAHGSDWNPAGEVVRKRLLDDPAFAAGLPASLVLVDVDLPEQGSRATLRRLLGQMPRPSGECVSAVTGKNGTNYVRRSDNSWAADPKSNPHHEVIDIRFNTGDVPAHVLRLELLGDPALAEGRSGRASNGNLAINEIELLADGGTTCPLEGCLADFAERHGNSARDPAALIDGDAKPSDRVWSVYGSDLKDQHLLLLPKADLPAQGHFTLRIHCLSPWGQHTPGRIRLDALPASPLDRELQAVAMSARMETRNRVVGVDATNLPALYLYGPDKRRFGAVTPIRVDETPAAVLTRLNACLGRRTERQQWLEKAQAAAAADKPEMLVRAALALGDDLDGETRKEVIRDLLKLDPQRENPWVWRFDFNLQSVHAEKERLIKEKGEQAGLDYLDGMVKSPRAAQLASEQRQQLILEKYLIVRGWKGHEDLQWDIFEAMARVDETTHLGLGARGHINYYGHGVPSMAYGWWPKHVQAGSNAIMIKEGVPLFLPVSGSYQLTLRTRDGSKDTAIFRGAALVSSEGKDLSVAKADVVMGKGKAWETSCLLQLPEGVDPATVRLRVDMELPNGTDHSCTLNLRPTLPEDGQLGWKK